MCYIKFYLCFDFHLLSYLRPKYTFTCNPGLISWFLQHLNDLHTNDYFWNWSSLYGFELIRMLGFFNSLLFIIQLRIANSYNSGRVWTLGCTLRSLTFQWWRDHLTTRPGRRRPTEEEKPSAAPVQLCPQVNSRIKSPSIHKCFSNSRSSSLGWDWQFSKWLLSQSASSSSPSY